jgi:hypothetical protein
LLSTATTRSARHPRRAGARTCKAPRPVVHAPNPHLGISPFWHYFAPRQYHPSYACHHTTLAESDEVLVGGKVPITGGCVHLTDQPGLGVTLDQDRLAEFHEAYQHQGRIRTRNDVAEVAPSARLAAKSNRVSSAPIYRSTFSAGNTRTVSHQFRSIHLFRKDPPRTTRPQPSCLRVLLSTLVTDFDAQQRVLTPKL